MQEKSDSVRLPAPFLLDDDLADRLQELLDAYGLHAICSTLEELTSAEIEYREWWEDRR